MARLPKLLAMACALAAAAAFAQTEHSVEGMIQQLQAPRTRSLGRNLVVEQAPATAGAASSPQPQQQAAVSPPAGAGPRPSLSLLIQFDFDSARVRAESVPLLEKLSTALKSPELAGSRFAVEGHTDAQGRADYNLKLSERRALAVRDMLVKSGVEPARLVAAGKGSTELANASDPRAAENRRVRIVNLD